MQMAQLQAQHTCDVAAIANLKAVGVIDRTMIAQLEAEGVIDRGKIVNLDIALATCRCIGAAIGIIMAVQKVTQEQAFDVLREASQTRNCKLRDIAEEILTTGAVAQALRA